MKTKINIIAKIFFLIIVLTIFNLIGCSKNNYGTNSNYNGGNNSGSNSSPGANEVCMQNFAFISASRTIAAGTKINWTNKENTTHSVVRGTQGNPNGIFNSGDLGSGGSFSYTFNTAGTFNYYCSHHTYMTGTIIVQ
jgi:plastocyanin